MSYNISRVPFLCNTNHSLIALFILSDVSFTLFCFLPGYFSLKKVIKLVPENLLKRRKAYQAIKATEAKLALQQKRKVRDVVNAEVAALQMSMLWTVELELVDLEILFCADAGKFIIFVYWSRIKCMTLTSFCLLLVTSCSIEFSVTCSP